jgi:hypothetical protein
LFQISFRILGVSTNDLQNNFDKQASDSIKQPKSYARNFLEYCCFLALAQISQVTGYLADKSFRRLSFDMMLAWEVPYSSSQLTVKVLLCSVTELVNIPSSLTSSMLCQRFISVPFVVLNFTPALQAEVDSTVSSEAFTRIAPAIPTIADVVTCANLFDVLSCSSGGRLSFSVYEKYLSELDRSLSLLL